MLFLADVYVDVVGFGGNTHDHPFIDLRARIDEQNASVLRVEQPVRNRLARFKRDERACVAAL